MANIMMPPIVSQALPDAGVDRKAQLPVAKEGSFAQHLEKKIQGKQAEKKDLLGVKPSKAQEASQPESDGPAGPPATVEAVLQQLMVDLKDMADKPGTEAGQWTFQLQDMGLLEKLAAQVGMDAATLAALKKQMEEQGGLPLADLFAALEKSFKDMGAPAKVTVAETYLPLLETILSKLGVTPEVIKQLDSQGVNGVDQLDLAAYLQGLQAAPVKVEGQDGALTQDAPPSCVLTDWELEQFSAMLAEAGVPAEKIEMMFPEKMPLWQKALTGLRPEQGDAPVEMDLSRLKDLLQQALAAVDEARPKADVPAFFKELETILTQAGFKSSDVGWTPVVQGTMKAVYEEVQKMIDQGNGQDDKSIEIMAKNDAIDEQWQLSGSDQALEALASGQESDLPNGDASNSQAPDVLALKADGDLAEQQNNVGSIDMKASGQMPAEPTGKVQAPPRLHFASELQQFAVEQISQGVLRGLKNNEHHLTLTLYPKELGEVKVDLQVRGSQLSATFVMENQKVKEAMESNMGEFKDNLERRGFSLGSMSVSVGQQDQSNDSNQRFAAAWEQIILNQDREKNAVPGASPQEFIRNDQATLRQGGISLFV